MKKIFPLLLLVILLATQQVSDSYASELSGSDRAHAKNAFLFVERKGWSDALLHARKANNKLLHKTIQWLHFRDRNSNASFDSISAFIKDNPDWPEQDKLVLRAEQALTDESHPNNVIKAWFKQYPPKTGRGKILLLQAEDNAKKSRAESERTALLKDAWINGDFEKPQEDQILSRYGHMLTLSDHVKRIDRLLWEDKISDAQRMLRLVTLEYKHLAEARILLMRDGKGVESAVNKVSKKLRGDLGLAYARMKWRQRKGMDSGVREILLSVPEHVPYPEKWWSARESQIRTALQNGNKKAALKLLKNHGQKAGQPLAEALFLSGWIKLEFMGNSKDAYKDFYTLFENVKFPVSKSRGAYWAGKAAEKNGNRDIAKGWYRQASAHPTTFYGQLASLKLDSTAPLRIPSPPITSDAEKKKFAKRELARVVTLLAEADQAQTAMNFIDHMTVTAKTPDEASMAAGLSRAISRVDEGVKAAKMAMQNNILLIDVGFPLISKYRPPVDIELALVHAITRQESQFDRTAKSPSNAMGMMQLLPSTAKEVAKKMGVGYSLARLNEREYNMNLGSAYLHRLIGSFDGSYIQAIAAYNAGPGRVRKWRGEFGEPGNTIDSAVNWIETIPFNETRNYVQRVIENLQVYRHLLSKDKTPTLKIGKDLLR